MQIYDWSLEQQMVDFGYCERILVIKDHQIFNSPSFLKLSDNGPLSSARFAGSIGILGRQLWLSISLAWGEVVLAFRKTFIFW